MRFRLAPAAAVAICACAALPPAAGAATAPGRIAISPNGGAIVRDVDGGRLTAAVALPDGDVVLAGGRFAKPDVLVELRRNGTPDPSFGAHGIVHLSGRSAPTAVWQLLAQPDGKLLVIGTVAPANRYSFSRFVVERLDPDGARDATYGTAGIASTGLQQTCECGAPAALTPSGELVVTGTAGQESRAVDNNPMALTHFDWIVEELTSAGTLDPAFGTRGKATVATADSGGITVDVLSDGSLVVSGNTIRLATAEAYYMTRLTASGAQDLTFAAGRPLTITPNWGTVLAQPDGSVLVLDMSGSQLARYTGAGAVDTSFGTNGTARVPFAKPLDGSESTIPQLLAGPAGDVLVATWLQGLTALDQEPNVSVLEVDSITPSGALDPTHGRLSLDVPFGGGASTFLGGPNPPLGQNSFTGLLLPRAHGSYLAVGTVGIAEPTGEGDGLSSYDFAAAAFTSAFAPDPRFGKPPPPLRLSVRVPAQRRRADAGRYVLNVTVDASAAGLCSVTVRDHGTVIAHSVVPVLRPGSSREQVQLTRAGRKLLRGGATVLLGVSASARDLLTQTAHATARGTL